jgi:hypothetical protein
LENLRRSFAPLLVSCLRSNECTNLAPKP